MFLVERRESLRPGLAGVSRTVEIMRELIERGGRDPLVIEQARSLVLDVPERAERAEIQRLYHWVQERVRFTRDPLNAETIVDPVEMVRRIQSEGAVGEDCDGATVLLGALLNAIGYPAEIVVFSHRPDGEPDHVLLETEIDGRRVRLDATVPGASVGQLGARPTRTYQEVEIMRRGLGNYRGGRRRGLGFLPFMPENQAALAGADQSGLVMASTGQREEDAFSSILSGVMDFGDWAFQTPIFQNWMLEQQADTVANLREIQGTAGGDQMAAYFGTLMQQNQALLARLDQAPAPAPQPPASREEKELPGWVVPVAVGAGALLLLVVAMK